LPRRPGAAAPSGSPKDRQRTVVTPWVCWKNSRRCCWRTPAACHSPVRSASWQPRKTACGEASGCSSLGCAARGVPDVQGLLLRPPRRGGAARRCLVDHVPRQPGPARPGRSEEHTSELQSRVDLVCRLLLEKKKTIEYLCYHYCTLE